MQKNWVKTALPGLGSGRNNLQTAIWGHSRQLDDQHRNPNINNKDHHVGQLTNQEEDEKVEDADSDDDSEAGPESDEDDDRIEDFIEEGNCAQATTDETKECPD